MKLYKGIQDMLVSPLSLSLSSSSWESTLVFATPPPKPWSEFKTSTTYIQQKQGVDYVARRVTNSPWPFTPIVLQVMDKTEQGTQKLILSRQLSTKLLAANATTSNARTKRKEARNTVVQKYREIYSIIACR